MFQLLKTILKGDNLNFLLKEDNQILINCHIIENNTDLKYLTIEHLDNVIDINYSSIKDFNTYKNNIK